MKRSVPLLIFLFFATVSLTTCKKENKTSCADGIQNGNETGVDCGGDCNACICGTVTGLTAAGATSTQITLSWNAATGRASRYILSYRIKGTTDWTVIDPATSPRTIGSLTPATEYEWRVQTLCDLGVTTTVSSTFTSAP